MNIIGHKLRGEAMDKLRKLRSNKKVVSSLVVVIIVVLAIILQRSFAVLTPVKSVTIYSEKTSYEEKTPGSWKIDKSAKWIDKGKARITFDLDTVMKSNTQYSDVILVLDISGSMSGDKLTRVKEDASKLIETLLSNDKNKAALITFEATSKIVDNLTNNKDKLINDINNLSVAGCTNYYQALVNVDTILKEYQKESNRETIVLFLTDGYPNEDTPNEVGQYNYLKNEYPYLTINGVQYEMGTDILDPIKKVSDSQYVADMKNLNNVLFDASVSPQTYKSFTITDYIDDTYFKVKNINSIETSLGKAELTYEEETPKVSWTIEEGNLKSGEGATMTIDIELKDEYLNQGGVYPTNKKEQITSIIEGNPDEDVTSNKTPILADNYVVKYEGNTPGECELTGVPEDEKHSVFETVAKSDAKPTCGSYQFKGWEIVTKDVTRVNDDYFIMPEEDVVLRATWGKLGINKSMDGQVSKVQTLYNVMADSAVPDNIKSEFVTSDTGINFGNISSNTNGKGVYQLSSTKDEEFPVYYYRGDVKNNNVKFADICWKAVRTTSTGGVKLIYNGVPDAEGKCTNTTGTVTQIETSAFNSYRYMPTANGYMYGTIYSSNSKSIPTWYSLAGKSTTSLSMLASYYISSSTASYYFGDEITWNGTNYVLSNSDGSEVVQTNYRENYNNLKGKYSCFSTTASTCTTVYYLAETTSSYAYRLELRNGQLLENVNTEWNFGKTVSYENGQYTIVDPETINRVDWYTKYSTYNGKGYYTCSDGSTSCTDIWYINSTSNTSMTNIKMSNGETYESVYEEAKNVKWIYGNDVSWDRSKYTLTNTIESAPLEWSSERSKIGQGYHYTCFTTDDSCSSVSYVYYTVDSSSPYYINLSNGITIDQAMEEMQTNTNDSKIKTAIDKWYGEKMTDYTSYLEDTVWCNDRSMGNSNGWTKDGNANNYLYYSTRERAWTTRKPDIGCSNKNDAFTVSEENGNGALTYPVALLTSDEVTLAGFSGGTSISNIYLNTNQLWWSLSPYYFGGSYASGIYVTGYIDNYYVNDSYGVRPSVSLRPGIRTDGGDGTASDPYTLELD